MYAHMTCISVILLAVCYKYGTMLECSTPVSVLVLRSGIRASLVCAILFVMQIFFLKREKVRFLNSLGE